MTPRTTARAATRRIDATWFKRQVRASRWRSLRRLAPEVRGLEGPLSISALSMLLSGKRSMRIEEARQLADLLAVPLLEVLRRAGIDTRGPEDDLEARHRAAVRMVGTLLAFIDEAGAQLPQRVRDQAAAIG